MVCRRSQAVQYSPAGILYALNDYNGLSTGQTTPQQFVNHLAKTFTGTSLAAVGALIASLGWLRGTSQEPDKERKYKQQLGEQDYALVLPDGGTYSLDWGAPGITPLLIGAAVHDTLAQKSGDVELDEAFFNVLE